MAKAKEIRLRPFILLNPWKWITIVYIFGEERITIQTGLLWRHREYIDYERLIDISVDENPLERLIGQCGDIHLKTVDKTAPAITLHNIIGITLIHDMLRTLMKEHDNIQRIEFLS